MSTSKNLSLHPGVFIVMAERILDAYENHTDDKPSKVFQRVLDCLTHGVSDERVIKHFQDKVNILSNRKVNLQPSDFVLSDPSQEHLLENISGEWYLLNWAVNESVGDLGFSNSFLLYNKSFVIALEEFGSNSTPSNVIHKIIPVTTQEISSNGKVER